VPHDYVKALKIIEFQGFLFDAFVWDNVFVLFHGKPEIAYLWKN